MPPFLKKVLTTLLLLGFSLLAGYYYVFNSGDKQQLAELLPPDTLAYTDIKNFRHFSLKIARNELTPSVIEFAQALIELNATPQSPTLNTSAPSTPSIEYKTSLIKLAFNIKRQVVLALLPSPTVTSEKIQLPTPVLLAHFQGNPNTFAERIDKITAAQNNQKEDPTQHSHWTSEKWQSHTIHILNTPNKTETQNSDSNTQFEPPETQPSWCVIDSKLYAAINSTALKKLISDTRQLQPAESLAASPLFKELNAHQKDRDIGAYFATSRFMPQVIEMIDKEVHRDGPNMLGISFKRIMSDTGILEADSVFFSSNLSNNSELLTTGIHISDKSGLWNIVSMNHESFAYPTRSPNGITSTGIYNLDLGDLSLWVKDVVLKNVPIAAMFYSPQKRRIDETLGTDLEQFLANAFTNELIIHTDYHAITQDNKILVPQKSITLSLQINSIEEFTPVYHAFLDAKKASNTPYQQIEIAKHTFYEMPSNLPEQSIVRFGVVDDKLLISYGGKELLKKILQTPPNPTTTPFLSKPVKTAFNKLPEGEGGLQFIDLNNPIKALSLLLKQELNKRPSPNNSIDWAKIQKLQKVRFASKSYETETGFYTQFKRVKN